MTLYTYRTTSRGGFCVSSSTKNAYISFIKPERKDIKPGMLVAFIQKHHKHSGEITEGIVKSILTSAPVHPHGIKIMTDENKVGRVVEILEDLEDLD
ncbi:YwbE family protein [Fluviicola taffensis]|uniref:YwbE family protein n=1 Tax=Fluviicola taffensis (strain DSM 16823 / NCIMB 13979 / RW262) TaxID=755732 RepID=F2I951_FLUTR|nr:YwbE family protein [Fluviicola taffensis]AEA42998.1 Protein of unknown function DUF2196 [Fluviicola taffensis DSM 16823]